MGSTCLHVVTFFFAELAAKTSFSDFGFTAAIGFFSSCFDFFYLSSRFSTRVFFLFSLSVGRPFFGKRAGFRSISVLWGYGKPSFNAPIVAADCVGGSLRCIACCSGSTPLFAAAMAGSRTFIASSNILYASSLQHASEASHANLRHKELYLSVFVEGCPNSSNRPVLAMLVVAASDHLSNKYCCGITCTLRCTITLIMWAQTRPFISK